MYTKLNTQPDKVGYRGDGERRHQSDIENMLSDVIAVTSVGQADKEQTYGQKTNVCRHEENTVVFCIGRRARARISGDGNGGGALKKQERIG
jgi:hypothetical protein